MLKTRKEGLEGKTCLISGSGNVAQYTVEKLINMGAKPVTLSDSAGYIYDEAGINRREAHLRHGPEERPARPDLGIRRQIQERGLHAVRSEARSQPALESQGAVRLSERDPERDQRQGRGQLLRNGVYVVSEGANMPTTIEGVNQFLDAGDSLRSGQSRQRRRRRHLRSRDGAKQHAHFLDARGSG